MTAKQFVKQLEKWGVDFEPYRESWATHNRRGHGNWGGMNGVMLHHTGTNHDDRRLLWEGRRDLPGPLCHVANDGHGKLWGIGWGRANHAGLGDDEVFRHVINEDYGKYPGYGNAKELNVDGNSHFYGMEVMYSGSRPMSEAQYNSMIRFCAAILDFHDWTFKSVIGHGEWQRGKWDPGYKPGHMMDMHAVRKDVQDCMELGPGNWPKPDPIENPPTKHEPSPVEDSTPNTYTVKSGDTLWSLAEKFLGDGNRWPEIVGKNPSVFPLPIGAELTFPKR